MVVSWRGEKEGCRVTEAPSHSLRYKTHEPAILRLDINGIRDQPSSTRFFKYSL